MDRHDFLFCVSLVPTAYREQIEMIYRIDCWQSCDFAINFIITLVPVTR